MITIILFCLQELGTWYGILNVKKNLYKCFYTFEVPLRNEWMKFPNTLYMTYTVIIIGLV